MKGTDNYAEALGIKLVEAKDGYAKVIMNVERIHLNGLGFTHGGAIFSLADYAFAHACNFGDNIAVAVQVSINFLRPSVEGDLLTAEATRISDSKNMGLYNVTVFNLTNKQIAVFTGLAFKKQA